MQLRAALLTVLAFFAASLAAELTVAPAGINVPFDGELAKDCILAGGRSSCTKATLWPLLQQCLKEEEDNSIFKVHFLLGPMPGVADLLQTLHVPPHDSGVQWYVQNRSEWDQSLMQLARSRTSFYDGLVLDPVIVPEMVASGALMDLQPFIATDLWQNQWPGILAALRWHLSSDSDSVFMLPLGAAAIVLHYRSDVLEAHGLPVPRTWEQLLHVVRTVHHKPGGPTEPGDSEFAGFCTLPFAGCHADAYELMAVWASFIQTSGIRQGAFFDPATLTPLVRNAGMAAAMRYYRQLASYSPPHSLVNVSTCNSLYGSAESLYESGSCAFQLAPHPTYKRNALLGASTAVRQFSRVTQLPGSTAVLDRATGRLVACSLQACPFAVSVQRWPGDAQLQAEVLGKEHAVLSATADGPQPVVLANVAPVLGLSPLALGINAFTTVRQQAFSLEWVRRVTDPEVVWRLVLSPATPLAPFRYEHFSPSNLHMWLASGYDADTIREYLMLSYEVLTHPNMLSFPSALQRIAQYRAALHSAAFNLTASDLPEDTIMSYLDEQLTVPFGPSSIGFGTLRLQYLVSIGRRDLLAAPSPPPPPLPPDVRYLVGRDRRSPDAVQPAAGVAIGAALGCVGAAALLALSGFLYKQLLVKRGWGRSKDPCVGPQTTLVVTDMEASTVLWEELNANVMDVALNLHHDTIRRVIVQWAGYESVTEGDSFTVAFHTAEAAVGFSLHVQSELMEQSWPPEVLMHDACRPVYVVSTKRLRHLTAKAASKHAAAVAMEAIDGSATGIPGRGHASGSGHILPARTFSKAARRIDMISGLSGQARRSMSFITRPVSTSASVGRGGSLLSAALAGGGSSTGAGGSAAGGSARGSHAPPGAVLLLAARDGAPDSVMLGASSAAQVDVGLTSTRNLFDHFLPFSGPMVPSRSGVAAFSEGALSPSLSLGKLSAAPNGPNAPNAPNAPNGPTGPNAPNGPNAGDIATHAYALGLGPGPAASTSFGSRNPRQQLSYCDSLEPSETQVSSGAEPDSVLGGGAAAAAAAAQCSAVPTQRVAGLLASTSGGVGLTTQLSMPRSNHRHSQITSVPEEPPPVSLLVRRTRSTVVVGDAAAAQAGGISEAAARATASGSGMLSLGRGLLRAFVEDPSTVGGRRPSRLADTPPAMLRTVDDGSDALSHAHHGGDGGGGVGGAQTAPRMLSGPSEQLPSPIQHGHSFLQRKELRQQQLLEDEQQLAGTPSGRTLRGWRSWTGLSIGILRRVQRSFKHGAGAGKGSFSGGGRFGGATAAGDGDGGRDDAGDLAVSATAQGGRTELMGRENVTSVPWEVESRSSSVSNATQNSSTSRATIQSALMLQPSRCGRRGGGGDGGSKTLYASPSTYGSELRALWSELPQDLEVDPASAGAVLVFRGFRVRCGMHSGVRTAAEINRNHPSGRTRYSGPALLCAKAVSDAAHGGMVFASRHTIQLCSPHVLAGRVVLWRLGDYVLGSPRLPATLYQLSNAALVLRAALQRPLSRTYMPLGLGLLDAPLTVVACAAIKLSSTLLEHAQPAVSIEVASVFQALCYQYARLHGGYLAQLGAGRAMCVFGDGYRAALWAAQVQSGMFRQPWSRELLAIEQCRPHRVTDAQGRTMFTSRGPRIKAIVHFGPVSTMLHPLTGQLSYEGGAVDLAMRLLGGLNTSGVVATLEAAASLRRYWLPDVTKVAAASGNTNSNSNGMQQYGSRRQTEADLFSTGEGSGSQRSSDPPWRDSLPRTHQQLHLLQQQQYDALVHRSRSSAERAAVMAAGVVVTATSGRDAGSSSGGGGGGGGGGGANPFSRVLSHPSPRPHPGANSAGIASLLTARSRTMVPRRASGPIPGAMARDGSAGGGGRSGSGGFVATGATSPSWRREELRGNLGRGLLPRAASPVIPGTDSANTSDGTDGTAGTGGTGGTGGGSQMDSDAGGAGAVAASRTGVPGFSLNLGLAGASRLGTGPGGIAAAGGDAPRIAAAAAAVATAGGNDSLMLLLTMSGELPMPTSGPAVAAYAAASAAALATGGGNRQDRGTVSGSGGSTLMGWMASAGGSVIPTTTSRKGPSMSQLDTHLASVAGTRLDGSTGHRTPPRNEMPPLGYAASAQTVAAIAVAAATASTSAGSGAGRLQMHAESQIASAAGSRDGGSVSNGGGVSAAQVSVALARLTGSKPPAVAARMRASRTAAANAATNAAATAAAAANAAAAAVVAGANRTAPGTQSAAAPPSPATSRPAAAPQQAAPALPLTPSPEPCSGMSDCRPLPGGGTTSPSASSAGSASPSPPLLQRRGSSRVIAAAAAVAHLTMASALPPQPPRPRPRPAPLQTSPAVADEPVQTCTSPTYPTGFQTCTSPTYPTGFADADANTEPGAAAGGPSSTLPRQASRGQRPPQLQQQRQLRQQNSARDNAAHVALRAHSGELMDPQRVYQSFTFGQRGNQMARPRLHDLMAVNPYSTTENDDGGEGSRAGEIQSHGGDGDQGDNARGRGGGYGGSRAGGGGGGGGGGEGGSSQADRTWAAGLPSPPSRTGNGTSGAAGGSGGIGPGSLEALIRGPNTRISRSFTFTTHRRSPLAVSSYAGDPEIGTMTNGSCSTSRRMSGLSRVLYGAGSALGVVGRNGAAAAPAPVAAAASAAAATAATATAAVTAAAHDASRDAPSRPAAPLPPPAAAATANCYIPRPSRRDAPSSASSSATSLSRRARRAAQAQPPHTPSGSPFDGTSAAAARGAFTAAASGLPPGPAVSSTSAPWAPSYSASPFSLHSEYARSSNSAGTLGASINSAQLRVSTGDLRGSGQERGSGASVVSANATPSQGLDALAVASAAAGPGAPAAGQLSSSPSGGGGGQLSSIFSRVRNSMARSRSHSLTRNFVTSINHMDVLAMQAGSSPRSCAVMAGLSAEPNTGSGELPSTSGMSARLAAASAVPSGSSGAGAGTSRTLRSVLSVDKLPTLPETGLAPLMRELRHLRLRLVPLRLASRGGAGKDASAAVEAAELVASVAAGMDAGALREEQLRRQRRREKEVQLQQSSIGRASEYMQVYRVLLVESEPQSPPKAPAHSPPHAHVHARARTETDPGVSSDPDQVNREAIPSGERTTPLTAPAAEEEEPPGELDLVSQFMFGFADLSDPALAELWSVHPERSLMQDRRLADVLKLRAMLAAQEAHAEVFDRDGFLF